MKYSGIKEAPILATACLAVILHSWPAKASDQIVGAVAGETFNRNGPIATIAYRRFWLIQVDGSIRSCEVPDDKNVDIWINGGFACGPWMRPLDTSKDQK
jgi:hypothetical protein